MRYDEHFRMATAGVRLYLRHQISRKTGDLSPDSRPLTRKDGDFLLDDILFCPVFTCGADPFHAFNLKRKIRC